MNSQVWLAVENKQLRLGETVRVIALRTGKAVDVETLEIEVLNALSRACSLKELQLRLVGVGWDSPPIPELAELVTGLEALGLVENPAASLSALRKSPKADAEVFALSALSWITCDRPEQLATTLAAWASKVRESGISPPEFVVSNDSRNQHEQTRKVVEQFAASYPGKTLHLDRTWREQTADRYPSALREALKFSLGLTDPGVPGLPSYGAASNTLLLAKAGQRFTMGDDDILPEFRVRSDALPGLAFQSALDPALFAPAESRSQLSEGRTSERPTFAPHLAFLGKPVASLLGEYPEPVLTNLTARDLHGATLPSARVAAVRFPYWGDSGLQDHRILLEHRELVDPRTFQGDQYQLLRGSREGLRAPVRDSLGGHTVLGGHIGIDATQIMPPFAPYGRNQDGLWAGLLGFLQPDSFLLTPREAILHAPTTARRALEPGRISVLPCVNDLLLALLTEFSATQANVGLSYRMAGTLFEQWGSRSPGIRKAALAELHLKSVLRLAAHLEDQLNHYRGLPELWANDVELALAHLETQLTLGTDYCPEEFQAAPGALGGYLNQFGQLLAAWPEIWEAGKT